MKKSVLREKSYAFSLATVRLVKELESEKCEFVMSRQLLRSATSIGAILHEAQFAESKKDFIHKFRIALKEANETIYWLNLLRDSGYTNSSNHSDLKLSCTEIVKMLIASIKKLNGQTPYNY